MTVDYRKHGSLQTISFEEESIAYNTPIQHLMDELELLDLRLRLLASQFNRTESFQIALSNFLTSPINLNRAKPSISGDIDSLEILHIEKRQKIDSKLEATKTQGTILPWQWLIERFTLDSFEKQLLILCLASWFDDRYNKLYSILLDDQLKSFPSIELAFLLTQFDDKQKPVNYLPFSKDRLIFEWNIIEPVYENSFTPTSPLKINGRISSYLNGNNSFDPLLYGIADLQFDTPSLQQLFFNQKETFRIESIIAHLRQLTKESGQEFKHWFYLYGPQSSGKKSIAGAICKELNLPVLFIDIAILMYTDRDIRPVIKSIVRESVLQPCGICLINFDRSFNDDEKSVTMTRLIIHELMKVNIPVFCNGKLPLPTKSWDNNLNLSSIEISIPEPDIRHKIWKKVLAPYTSKVTLQEIAKLAERFQFTAGEIAVIARTATSFISTDSEITPLAEKITAYCVEGISSRLPLFATRVTTPFSWDDLVLPDVQLDLLRDICAHAVNHSKIYNEWGFSKKVASGRGINVLFTGISGTGKTMTAGIIARELGLELLRIDLSLVISKYIGETEKNLAAIFHQAESGRSILFFDEADALFGKRSAVKDAHDRYANIEVAYLLQKMEDYEGISILATNFRQNIDDAFTRRMHFIVEFPLPDRTQREKLWQKVFPVQAPLKEIDFSYLARQFTITGANIKNIAINAAFNAAGKGEPIHMNHILQEVRREFKKTGAFIAEDTLVYNKMEWEHN